MTGYKPKIWHLIYITAVLIVGALIFAYVQKTMATNVVVIDTTADKRVL